MKVVLVTHDSAFGRYVAATLAAAGQVDRIIIETTRATPAFYWRKFRRVGPINFLFQYFLNRWFTRAGASALPHHEFPPHEQVTSINSLVFAADELVLGFGTSYVSAQTLAAAPNGVLNLHTGYLPNYRGVKSEFWTLRARDFSHLGWTVHYMTTRLDAGDIVLRGTIPWNGESPAIVRAHLVRAALPEIVSFLAGIRTGTQTITRTPQEERQATYYSTPTWREWRNGRSVWQR